MNDQPKSKYQKTVFLAQVVSVSLIWVFVIGIAIWIANLISLSLELQDVPGASVGISIVAIPVFFILASILTYVFIGLQKKPRSSHASEEK
jgi:hypothetical protein